MELLCKFIREHQHARVPIKLSTPEYPGLGRWVRRQRRSFAAMQKGGGGSGGSAKQCGCRMTAERAAKLREAGFHFTDPGRSRAWDTKFELLQKCVVIASSVRLSVLPSVRLSLVLVLVLVLVLALVLGWRWWFWRRWVAVVVLATVVLCRCWCWCLGWCF